MRLTRQSEIALEILAACARSGATSTNTARAAESGGASKDAAAQIVNLLARSGFIKAMRGRNGGIKLAVPAREILLGDVLRATQPDLGLHADERNRDRLETVGLMFNAILGAAEATFLTFLDRFSVADLVGQSAHQRLNCLDCELLNPARRKPGRQHSVPPHDDARTGLLSVQRTKPERDHRHADISS
ncbi:RrF2 family transcriptional regulator [Shinella pollutisoli]|uniref:RrF2 family transcriptional regulator n=1 Tax=Shinella pollutisoli TaxID=2250594 RepID=A0ABV7DN90_9HYPH|nr:Rrf2 family transcriptional regulator [Shinella pollutisoli]